MKRLAVLVTLLVTLSQSALSQSLVHVQDYVYDNERSTRIRGAFPSPDGMRVMIAVGRDGFGQGDPYMEILDLRGVTRSGRVDVGRVDDPLVQWRDSGTLENWKTRTQYSIVPEQGALRITAVEHRSSTVSVQLTENAAKYGLRSPEPSAEPHEKRFPGLNLFDGLGKPIVSWRSPTYIPGLSILRDGEMRPIIPLSRGSVLVHIDELGRRFEYPDHKAIADSMVRDIDYDPQLNRLFVTRGRTYTSYYIDQDTSYTFPYNLKDIGPGITDTVILQPLHGSPYYVKRKYSTFRAPDYDPHDEGPADVVDYSIEVIDDRMNGIQVIEPFFGVHSKEDFEKHVQKHLGFGWPYSVDVFVADQYVTISTFGVDETGQLVKGFKIYGIQ